MFIAFLEVTRRMLFLTGHTGILSGGGLEYLSLSTLCKCSRGNGLAAIGFGIAPNLRILNFRECSFVKNDAIIRILIACPLLQECYLSYCTKIKLSGSDPRNGCESLSVMYMSHWTNLTSKAVHAFKTTTEGVEIKEEEAMHVTSDSAFTTLSQCIFPL
ncbi:hypothetical protein OSB04_008193 [Centaurea solstitialis]|uniref:Uncharacterized protein n=1 Tax=Centaurea solstitialis TaxID=347529 RepID=A0AA38U5T8_9ASTR|nr:hypothetical protein OSB04_008193 [Centaurea solstitialis]